MRCVAAVFSVFQRLLFRERLGSSFSSCRQPMLEEGKVGITKFRRCLVSVVVEPRHVSHIV